MRHPQAPSSLTLIISEVSKTTDGMAVLPAEYMFPKVVQCFLAVLWQA